jgi:serpin B
MVLVNAIYFKGDWLEEFEPKLTETKPFYLGSTERKLDVQMMQLTSTFRTGKIEELDARFLELGYKVYFVIKILL